MARAQSLRTQIFVRIRVQVLHQLQIAVRMNPQNQDQRAGTEEDGPGNQMLYFTHLCHLG